MDSFDQEIMARTAIGEARGEGQLAMQAVMWTGLNRYLSKRWYSGQSVAGTFLKFEQYDCWMPKDPNYGLITNIAEDNSGLFAEAMQWAAAILSGEQLSDPVYGATHYYDDSILAPVWAANATMVKKIGKLNFYKNVA